MRTIKFRGKRIDDGNWIYGYLSDVQEQYGYAVIDYSFTDAEGNWEGCDNVDQKTVGEFTGLYDNSNLIDPAKKKKPIYEGDILKCGSFNGVITWHPNGYWCVHTREDEVEKYSYTPLGSMIEHLKIECLCCEVIGNIHDNPELMKGE